MNRLEFDAAVEAAKPGAAIVYHTGHMFGGDRRNGLHFLAVDNVARAAWNAMEAGKIHLVQKRIRDGAYAYMAIKRPPPFKKVEWLGCYNTSPLYTKPVLQAA